MDPYLRAIVEAVERGADPVMISMALDSGAIVRGFVRHSAAFVKLSKNELEVVDKQRAAIKWAKAPPSAESERIPPLLEKVRPEGDEAITLSDVTMVWSSGDGVKMLTLRVNPEAVTSWWLGGGQPITGKKDSSGGFWAISVPIG